MIPKWTALIFFCCFATSGAADTQSSIAKPDVLIADFEGENYGDWKSTGAAFGSGPASGTLPGQMMVSGFEGKRLVNSFASGDGSRGTLSSPPLIINRRYLKFLIGGGHYPGQTCINLRVDGQIVRTQTGPNKQPGGTEALEAASWDVGDLQGKTAVIEIVDEESGGWGHITIDHILMTDKKPEIMRPQQKPILIQKRYLHLPVKNGAAMRRMSLLVQGHKEREWEIELADAQPDFWVFLDVTAFHGRQATLEVDKMPETSAALRAVVQADDIPDRANLYAEKYRPQFHFSAQRGWLNDPNGLVFYKGEYHLFFQHNPYGIKWGNMHWGHAVSPDLVHWQELPIALYPRQFDDWAFSGSAVVDWDNTSGFQKGRDKVLVAAYTSTGRGECIVYSNDRGRTWKEFEGNPVLKHSGRDPRLLWHAPSKRWVMAVYDETNNARDIVFYSSPDLKTWKFGSRIGGFYECPDLFELPVDGDLQNTRWILSAANGDYLIGRFDGQTFVPQGEKQRGNAGNCLYAAQTFSDIPTRDGRRIQIGWARIEHPNMPFNQMMSFPCELTLRTTPDGLRMCAKPVREIKKLNERKQSWKNLVLKPGDNPLSEIKGERFDIRAEFDVQQAAQLGFTIRGIPVIYDTSKQELTCLDRKAPLKLAGGRLQMQILVDRTSIEIFANDGLIYMPMGNLPIDENRTLELFSKGGNATIKTLEVNALKSAWAHS